MLRTFLPVTLLVAMLLCQTTQAAEKATVKIKVLILDGQNNHNWRSTTPVMKKTLESAGLFTVDVSTSPGGRDLSKWSPQFSKYGVIVSNYNGAPWSEKTQKAFVDYTKGGGGVVIIHAANNSFGSWKEYNEIIGLGGWGGRSEKSGPYVYFKDGKIVRDTSKGRGGSHGAQRPFQVIVRNSDHPVTKGMPAVWLHAKDELYDRLRGPAENMTVLATAYSEPKAGGRGEHEPMIFTVSYGKGRVFHTPMGHADYSMKCAGFQATLCRGAEWAATGKVTQEIPKDFPTANKVSTRK
ncbi:MAG: ThuA domain-containing protein [Planctomycetes bacterium]|nr:ThuA domain-containing protein [Planctomycetota bacterium]